MQRQSLAAIFIFEGRIGRMVVGSRRSALAIHASGSIALKWAWGLMISSGRSYRDQSRLRIQMWRLNGEDMREA